MHRVNREEIISIVSQSPRILLEVLIDRIVLFRFGRVGDEELDFNLGLLSFSSSTAMEFGFLFSH